MKIQLDQELENSPGVVFPVGSVITVGDSDGQRLIDEGIGHQVPDHIPDTIDPEATMEDARQRRELAEALSGKGSRKKKSA